jgi:tryptophan-rich sensory protein
MQQNDMTKVQIYSGLLGWIALSFLAGAIGSTFEPGVWYEALIKPEWTPPDIVFPIVWPVLYLLMGIAAWMIWRECGFTQCQTELTWFCVQLILNAAWSWLFFGLNLTGTALAEILLLWIAILFTMMLFWRRNVVAGVLLLPYLLWVSYASALNFAIWQLN